MNTHVPGVLADPEKRARLVADIVDEMNYEILEASLLAQFITGKAPCLTR